MIPILLILILTINIQPIIAGGGHSKIIPENNSSNTCKKNVSETRKNSSESQDYDSAFIQQKPRTTINNVVKAIQKKSDRDLYIAILADKSFKDLNSDRERFHQSLNVYLNSILEHDTMEETPTCYDNKKCALLFVMIPFDEL